MASVFPNHADAAIIVSTIDQNILHIELNRPQVRNSINDEVAAQLGLVFDKLDQDPNLRVAVLSGRGAGFCAGLDLKAFLKGETGMHPTRGFAGLTQQPPVKPLIAAIEGFALAGGLEIALACDLVVAGEHAKFGLPEVQRGLVADGGGLLHLPRRVSYQFAMEIALLGERFTATRAAEEGLINRAVADGDAVAEALRLAQRIAQNGPLAVQATKAILTQSRDWAIDDAWDKQDRIAKPVWNSDDAEEGAVAFAEKRDPVFRGK